MRRPAANKQLLYVAAHLRLYCQKQETKHIRAIDFIEYLTGSPDVFVGSERSTLPKDALVFIHRTVQDRKKVIRARSSSFFKGLCLHKFVFCTDANRSSNRFESKCFVYNENASAWREAPLLRPTDPPHTTSVKAFSSSCLGKIATTEIRHVSLALAHPIHRLRRMNRKNRRNLQIAM